MRHRGWGSSPAGPAGCRAGPVQPCHGHGCPGRPGPTDENKTKGTELDHRQVVRLVVRELDRGSERIGRPVCDERGASVGMEEDTVADHLEQAGNATSISPASACNWIFVPGVPADPLTGSSQWRPTRLSEPMGSRSRASPAGWSCLSTSAVAELQAPDARPVAARWNRQLGPGSDPELLDDVAQVVVHRSDREEEPVRDHPRSTRPRAASSATSSSRRTGRGLRPQEDTINGVRAPSHRAARATAVRARAVARRASPARRAARAASMPVSAASRSAPIAANPSTSHLGPARSSVARAREVCARRSAANWPCTRSPIRAAAAARRRCHRSVRGYRPHSERLSPAASRPAPPQGQWRVDPPSRLPLREPRPDPGRRPRTGSWTLPERRHDSAWASAAPATATSP